MIIVTGCDTNVGKTLVSAILATALDADYWKPVQCGDEEDSKRIESFGVRVHPSAYRFKTPLSPHHAARLEGVTIDPLRIQPPLSRPLIVETAGGVFATLTTHLSTLDLFSSWDAQWIIVSRHYLGSINHTLLTVEALRHCRVAGIIFNGFNPDSEEAILHKTQLPCLGHLDYEREFNLQIIEKYAKRWKEHLASLEPCKPF